MQEILLTVRYFERGLWKSLKRLTLFFLLNPFPFNWQNCKKQKKPGTSDQSFFRVKNNFRKIPLFLNSFISVLSDHVWWCNIKPFLSYSKIRWHLLTKLDDIWNYDANSRHHKIFHFHLPFWIWKVWKEREKTTKIWISQDRKELLDEIKSSLHSFWKAIIWSKK